MAKVLIIEDDESIRRLLRYDLIHAGHDAKSARDGQEGFDLAMQDNYDVILIDWMLPKLSGIDIVSQLRQQHSQAVLFMITAKDDEEDILEAFEAGVDDYLIKPFSPRQLQARIQAHLRRSVSSEHEKRSKYGSLLIDENLREIWFNENLIPLTKKEYELLIFLLASIDKVLTREQILTEIWNFDYDGDTRIVDVHIFKLRSKLDNTGVSIRSVRGVGYVAKVDQ